MKNLLKKNNFPKTGHTGYWLGVRGVARWTMYITNWIKDRLNQKKEKLESVSYTNVKELALTKMSDSPILFVDNGKENIGYDYQTYESITYLLKNGGSLNYLIADRDIKISSHKFVPIEYKGKNLYELDLGKIDVFLKDLNLGYFHEQDHYGGATYTLSSYILMALCCDNYKHYDIELSIYRERDAREAYDAGIDIYYSVMKQKKNVSQILPRNSIILKAEERESDIVYYKQLIEKSEKKLLSLPSNRAWESMPTQPIYIFHYKKDAPAFGSSIRKIEMKEIDNFYISKSGEYIKHSVVERIGLEGDCLIHITFSRELSNKQKEKLDNYFYNDFSFEKIPLDDYKQIATQKVKKLNEQIEQGLDIFEIISGNKY